MSSASSDAPRVIRQAAILIVIASLGAGGGALAMSWIGRASQPKLWMSQEAVDLGVMAPFAKTSRSIVLRNTGGSKLVIQDMQASCACTDVELPTRELEPGSETALKLNFTAGESPYSQATITLVTNDPSEQVRFIELRAQKPWGIEVEPRTLFFTSVGASQEVAVSTSRDDVFKEGNEVSATSASEFVTTKVVPEHKKLRAVVVVRRSDQEVTGAFVSSIHVSDKKGLIDEKVRLQLAGQSQIFLPRPGVTMSLPDNSTNRTEDITVLHRTGEPVEVASVDLHGEVRDVLSVDRVNGTEGETIITLGRRTDGKTNGELARLRGYLLVRATAGGREEIFSLPISVSARRQGG